MSLIYAARGDGLGTRLLTAIYGRILATLLNFPFKIIWPPLGSDFYSNYDVLNPDLLYEVFSENYMFRGNPKFAGEFVKEWRVLEGSAFFYVNQDMAFLNSLDLTMLSEHLRARDGLVYDFPYPLDVLKQVNDFDLEIKNAWAAIDWSLNLNSILDEIDQCCDLQNTITLHLRRGDLVTMLNEAPISELMAVGMMQIFQRYAALRTFFDEIDRVRTNENIFICSEDEGADVPFKRRYGAENVRSSSDFYCGTPNQKAFVDLILLSRSKILIAPHLSYFSTCAATVGNVQLRSVALDLQNLIEELLQQVVATNSDRYKDVAAVIYCVAANISRDSNRIEWFNEFTRQAKKYNTNIVAELIVSGNEEKLL